MIQPSVPVNYYSLRPWKEVVLLDVPLKSRCPSWTIFSVDASNPINYIKHRAKLCTYFVLFSFLGSRPVITVMCLVWFLQGLSSVIRNPQMKIQLRLFLVDYPPSGLLDLL